MILIYIYMLTVISKVTSAKVTSGFEILLLGFIDHMVGIHELVINHHFCWGSDGLYDKQTLLIIGSHDRQEAGLS